MLDRYIWFNFHSYNFYLVMTKKGKWFWRLRYCATFDKHRLKVLLIKVLIKKWKCWSKVPEKFSNHSLFSPLKDDQDSGFWSAPLHLDALVGEPPQQRPQPWFCDHFIYFSKNREKTINRPHFQHFPLFCYLEQFSVLFNYSPHKYSSSAISKYPNVCDNKRSSESEKSQ